eukprot:jgi/Botrbrau1/7711/Bobra.0159s0145.2
MQIFVKRVDGACEAVQAQPLQHVHDLLQLLQGAEANNFLLTYNGRVIPSQCTFEQLGISDGTAMDLFLRLRYASGYMGASCILHFGLGDCVTLHTLWAYVRAQWCF